MANVTTEVRAWQLLQYAEVEMAKGNVDKASLYVQMAGIYSAIPDAEETTGLTAWFSHAPDSAGIDQHKLEFTVQTVTGASAPTDGEVTWDFGTGESLPAITNKALTSNVATLTTASAHGLAVGQKVLVAIGDATFDGLQTINGTPTATTFTFAKTAANVGSAAATGTIKVAGLTAYNVFAALGTYTVTVTVASGSLPVVIYSRTLKVPFSTAS